MTEEESIVGASAYPYTDEVLVEVTCRGSDGDLVVYSYSFESASADDASVRPTESVPDRHREVVVAALAEKDLEPTTDLVEPAG